MRINNNISAINTHRQYTNNNSGIAKSTEKLSSGYRINRAGDDAAGLAISEKMRAQIRGLNMASKNSQDAISLVQTAEGALQESHNILQRMRELAVQSASDTNKTEIDREALELEFQQLIAELDDIADKTRFNDQNVIDGTFSKVYTELNSLAGFMTANNTSFSARTLAGIYDLTVNYTAANPILIGGVNADVNAGTLGQVSTIASLKLEGLDAYTGSGTNGIGGVTQVTGVTLADVEQLGSNGNQFKLTFEVTTAAGTDTLTYLAELDANGAITVGGEQTGNALELTLTVNQGASAAQVMTDLEALRGNSFTGLSAGDADVEFATPAKIAASLTNVPNTIGQTSAYNGVYTIELVDHTNGTDLSKLTVRLIDKNNQVAYETAAFNFSAWEDDQNATYSINLGQFGIIELEDDGTGSGASITFDDLKQALEGRTLVVTNGADPLDTGTKAAAEVTVQNADGTTESIALTVGMTKFTTESGITFLLDNALTEADFSNQNTFNAVFGGTNQARLVIGEVNGKEMVIQTGANEGDELAINIDMMNAWFLGVDNSSIATREDASKAITQTNDAINQISMQRAHLGALQNRLEHKIANLDTSAENLQAAESRIRDVDMAKEMSNYTKYQILQQASIAMLAQANSAPQGVLQLLG